MLKFGSEIALEVVLDDKDAEKVRVAASTEDVPRKSRGAESGDSSGMKEPESVAPAFGEERPEEDCACTKNNPSGAFGQNGKAEEKTKKNGNKEG